MAVQVARIRTERGTYDGRPTLIQQFLFSGEGVDAAVVEKVLLEAPLTGERSIFGSRPGTEVASSDAFRQLRGFSPVAGFRFDVTMTRLAAGLLRVRFSQPERARPYLEGDAVWSIRDQEDGVLFDEQINTEVALEAADHPLGGPAPSLRRWLFFRMGHERVMDGATAGIAALVSAAG